jgi:hypothetical protein
MSGEVEIVRRTWTRAASQRITRSTTT